MPLYMDVHTIDGGVGMDDVAKVHVADLQRQAKDDVRYLRFWVNEKHGKVFCLVEAPSADGVNGSPGGPWARRRRRLPGARGLLNPMKLLHIVATPCDEKSNTHRVSNVFLEGLAASQPDLQVDVVDLFNQQPVGPAPRRVA